MKQKIFNIFITLAVCGLGTFQYLTYTANKDAPAKEVEEIVIEPEFFSKNPEEGLLEALNYYGVKHPNIVYAQAVLETGNFQSKLCKDKNNLFGLYDSYNKKYYKFDHWTESVLAYIDKVEYKFKGGDYYEFLERLPYAEDKNYIYKVKQIESNLPP